MISPTIVAAILTIVFGVIATLIGLAYRNLLKRVCDIEDDTETHQGKYSGLSDKVDTLWRWAFGVPEDETDGGLAEEIQNGFDNVEDDIDDMKKKQETYHEVEMNYLERLVSELHHADSLEEVERDDLEDD